MFCTRCLRSTAARRQLLLPAARQFSTSFALREPAAAAAAVAAEPKLSTPVTAPGEAPKTPPPPRSSCPEGTVLKGLNYTKGGEDPVAKRDEDYPEWLWSCLDVMKQSETAADEGLGDEFCKFLSFPLSLLFSSFLFLFLFTLSFTLSWKGRGKTKRKERGHKEMT